MGTGSPTTPRYENLPFCYAPGTRQRLPCESFPAERVADAAEAAQAYWSALCNRFPERENACSAFFTWPEQFYEWEDENA